MPRIAGGLCPAGLCFLHDPAGRFCFHFPWRVLGRTSDVNETGVFGFFIAFIFPIRSTPPFLKNVKRRKTDFLKKKCKKEIKTDSEFIERKSQIMKRLREAVTTGNKKQSYVEKIS